MTKTRQAGTIGLAASAVILGATVLGRAQDRPGVLASPSGRADTPSPTDQVRVDGRPNVIVIVADDLGFGDLSEQGDRQISTPNIDSIAKNGVRFKQGYVTGPYCSPTRAGLISGRYQERHGHDFNPDGEYDDGPEVGLSLDESTIADAFHSAGYRTGAVGKWHLGVSKELQPTSRGFDEFFGFLPAAHAYIHPPSATQPFAAKIPGQHPGSLLRNTTVVEEKEYTTDAFGREASAFVRRNQGRPFFLYLATNAVHEPLQAPQKYLDRVPNVTGKRKTYLAMLSALDDNVGKVLTALRETGAEDNTLITFISDNGGPTQVNGSNNGPLHGGKATVWEGGIRVPFYVQWKARLPQGVDLEPPVAQIDIFPTAIEAAGIPTPKNKTFDGVSFLPLAEQRVDQTTHKQLFWRFGAQWAVRDGNWKLALTPGASTPALYDLSSDLGETADRAAEHPELVQKLTTEWQQWNKDNADPRWVPPGFRAQPTPKPIPVKETPDEEK
jgi:arylsulfatase A-like enzyme